MSKCKYCKEKAEWAMQFIANREPSFYFLGWHIRGFNVIKLCNYHKDGISTNWKKASKLDQKDFVDKLSGGMLYPLG